MKTISILLACATLALGTLSQTSCSNVGGVTGAVQTTQQWLNDPAHQAEINAIANTVISIAGALGKRSQATIIGQVAPQHPDVPAGAIAAIVKNPNAYLKN